MNAESLKEFLDRKVEQYNHPSFIANDPISVPHLFALKQDIEIAGFFAAIFSWGKRSTIISKSKELMQRMDHSPYQFVIHHESSDLKNLMDFTHRTFNGSDLLYFIQFLRLHYLQHESLETAFAAGTLKDEKNIEKALDHFRSYFFSKDHERRTEKHIASPQMNSACKRLNMFLRWMVRKDSKQVDFGMWTKISASQLVCPVDVHVARVARKLGLINRTQADWLTAEMLTENLKQFDATDPVKYDFALFGLGIAEQF